MARLFGNFAIPMRPHRGLVLLSLRWPFGSERFDDRRGEAIKMYIHVSGRSAKPLATSGVSETRASSATSANGCALSVIAFLL